jgi:hypothetical protein
MRRLIASLRQFANDVRDDITGGRGMTVRNTRHFVILMAIMWSGSVILSHQLVYMPIARLLSDHLAPVPWYALCLNAVLGVAGSIATIVGHRLAYMSGYCPWCRDWGVLTELLLFVTQIAIQASGWLLLANWETVLLRPVFWLKMQVLSTLYQQSWQRAVHTAKARERALLPFLGYIQPLAALVNEHSDETVAADDRRDALALVQHAAQLTPHKWRNHRHLNQWAHTFYEITRQGDLTYSATCSRRTVRSCSRRTVRSCMMWGLPSWIQDAIASQLSQVQVDKAMDELKRQFDQLRSETSTETRVAVPTN